MVIPTNSTAEVTVTSRSLLVADPGESTTAERLGPFDLLLMAAWFGLVTGLLELVLRSCWWSYDPAARLGHHLMNRHYLWMIPVADLMIFGVGGLVLGWVARIWPKAALRLAAYLLCGLAALDLILVIPGLHKVTSVLLACGLASLTAPLIAARPRLVRRHARRGLPWLVGAVAALACFSHGRESLSEHRALTRLPAASPGTPNVLLIVLDTVRADALSLYGYVRDTSPNLVRLARKGVRFDHARSTSNWTLSSHGSMFTGRWSHELAVGVFRPLNAKYPTLAGVLGARGYITAGFVANPFLCHADYGLARGFDHYEDISVSPLEVVCSSQLGDLIRKIIDIARYNLSELWGNDWIFRVFGDDSMASPRSSRRKDAARINRDALKWMSAQKGKGRPYFVFLNYFDAHDPYFPPRGAERRFGLRPSNWSERTSIRNWSDIHQPSSSTIELARDGYDDCIAYLDDQLGRLFHELDSRGLIENTVVIITSDHGESFGEHRGIFGHTKTVYRPEIHVPLLVIAPRGVPQGRIVSTPVSLRDLSATVLDLVGLGRESLFPGRSLARFWDPGTAGDPSSADPVLSEHENEWLPASDRSSQSLSTGEMVYIRNTRGDEELYNIAVDPMEARNLAGSADARPVLEHFRTTLEQLLADTRTPDARAIRQPAALHRGEQAPRASGEPDAGESSD
jgi:arylsulfatase A-like enzyme